MRKEEQRLWDTMKRNAPPHVWLERVENLVGDGMPDVHFASYRAIAWVELKAAKLPARPTTRVLGGDGLRQSQKNWHKQAAWFGLPVYTLIRDDEKNLYLVHCSFSDELNEMPIAQLRSVSVAANWSDIFNVLKDTKFRIKK